MRLYLVRHGEAQPRELDGERRLTAKGEADARRLAAFLKALALSVNEVWHSGKARARQTAEAVSEAIRAAGGVHVRGDLGPLDDPGDARQEVEQRGEDLMIVGHMPFLSRLGSALLTDDESADFLALGTAGAACLERDEDGKWRLVWQVSPGVLG